MASLATAEIEEATLLWKLCYNGKRSVSRQEFPLSKCVSFLHLRFPSLTFVVSVCPCLFSLLAAAVKVGWPSSPSCMAEQRFMVCLGIGLSDPWEDERARPSFLPCLVVCFLSPSLSVLNCHKFLQLNSGQSMKHLVRLKIHGFLEKYRARLKVSSKVP